MNSKRKEDGPLPRRWISCPIEVDYFGEERKSSKAERKAASAKDRSKYKKTDQRKQTIKSQQALNKEELLGLERGRIVSIASQGINVDIEGEIVVCTLRGVLKKDKTQAKNLATVGDFVLLEREDKHTGTIAQIEPRRSILLRAENLSRRKAQLIAANIDQVMITTAVVSPPIKASLIDRYIIAAQKGGMEPIVVINKIDLLSSSPESLIVDQEKELYEELLVAYEKAGIPVISLSTVTGEGIDLLKKAMQHKASVFSGQSGVGKSSLINAVTGNSLRVGEIVEKTNKGTHTTTTAQLLRLEFGGWCIDTPGIKSFGVWDLEAEEIEQYFPEIFACGHACRFPDCSHFVEEGCAVKEAVEKGEISILRYESYLTLMQSVKESHFRR